MAVKLIPSVLATRPTAYRTRLKIAEHLSPVIHLDVMDGAFVPTRSVGWSTICQHPPRRNVDLHAMVRQPAQLLPLLVALQPRRVFLHVELPEVVVRTTMAVCASRRIKVGLAINPGTTFTRLVKYVPALSAVMVMGVKPGRYHSRWQPSTLRTLSALRRRWPKLPRVFDGGADQATLPRIIRAGAQEVILGSAVMLASDPAAAWQRLKQLTTV